MSTEPRFGVVKGMPAIWKFALLGEASPVMALGSVPIASAPCTCNNWPWSTGIWLAGVLGSASAAFNFTASRFRFSALVAVEFWLLTPPTLPENRARSFGWLG